MCQTSTNSSICLGPNWVPSYISNGYVLGPCGASPTDVTRTDQGKEVRGEFVVNVSPNPSSTNFRIQVKSPVNGMITIHLMDAAHKILSKYQVNNSETITVGQSLRPGIYFAEIIQGSKQQTIMLSKYFMMQSGTADMCLF